MHRFPMETLLASFHHHLMQFKLVGQVFFSIFIRKSRTPENFSGSLFEIRGWNLWTVRRVEILKMSNFGVLTSFLSSSGNLKIHEMMHLGICLVISPVWSVYVDELTFIWMYRLLRIKNATVPLKAKLKILKLIQLKINIQLINATSFAWNTQSTLREHK